MVRCEPDGYSTGRAEHRPLRLAGFRLYVVTNNYQALQAETPSEKFRWRFLLIPGEARGYYLLEHTLLKGARNKAPGTLDFRLLTARSRFLLLPK